MANENHRWPPEVLAEFNALPEQTDDTYVSVVGASSPEVMIMARRLVAEEALRDRIEPLVMARAMRSIETTVRWHAKVSMAEHDDAVQEMFTRFWAAIQNQSGYEYRFNQYMRWLALDVGKEIRDEAIPMEEQRNAFRAMGGDNEEFADDEHQYAAIEGEMVLEEGLRTLPPRLARPLRLHYVLGLPIFSKDPEKRSVASTLHYSESRIREIMRQARAEYRRWLQGEAHDGER